MGITVKVVWKTTNKKYLPPCLQARQNVDRRAARERHERLRNAGPVQLLLRRAW